MRKEKSIVTTLIIGTSLTLIFIVFVVLIVLAAFRNEDDELKTVNEEPKTVYKVRIPQKIGGELICEVDKEDNAIIKETKINYYYKNGSDSALFIGEGEFFGVEWKPREQLIKIGDWYYLRTGAGRKGENLNFGKLEPQSQWWRFTFSPEQIATDSVWKNYDVSTFQKDISAYMRITNIDTVARSVTSYLTYQIQKGRAWLQSKNALLIIN